MIRSRAVKALAPKLSLLLALFLGSAEQAAAQAPAGSAGGDAVILKVDGENITKAELDASVAYRKTYTAGSSDEVLQRAALDEELIPIAAVRAKYKDRLPELKKRIDELHAQAAAPGADFAAIARSASECPSAKEGGDLKTFARTGMVQPFARYAFTVREGAVSEPFLTIYGYHFIKVTGTKKGRNPATDQSRASHVLVMFDKSPNYANQIQSITQNAQVEIVDPSYESVVPAKFKKAQK